MLIAAAILVAFLVGALMGALATWAVMLWIGVMSLSDEVFHD